MRQTISGLIAAAAVLAASAAPAMACGWGYPCGPAYVPAVPVYTGCGACGWGFERLPDPDVQYHRYSAAPPQYYYVNQGPTYTGPGQFAPYPYYAEAATSGVAYGYGPSYYGYAGGHYAPRAAGAVIYRYHGHAWHAHSGYGWHHSVRYGYHGAPHRYSYRYHAMHRHY